MAQTHKYYGWAAVRVITARVAGALSWIVMTAMGLFFSWGYFGLGREVGLLCFGIGFCMIGSALGAFFWAAYPDIHTDESGLQIQFLWRRIFIPWAEITGVEERGFPKQNIVLVRAKRITPFHAWYSWYYARTIEPSFLVAKSIQGYDDLIRMIRRRALLS
jgi:hypothetical protein